VRQGRSGHIRLTTIRPENKAEYKCSREESVYVFALSRKETKLMVAKSKGRKTSEEGAVASAHDFEVA